MTSQLDETRKQDAATKPDQPQLKDRLIHQLENNIPYRHGSLLAELPPGRWMLRFLGNCKEMERNLSGSLDRKQWLQRSFGLRSLVTLELPQSSPSNERFFVQLRLLDHRPNQLEHCLEILLELE